MHRWIGFFALSGLLVTTVPAQAADDRVDKLPEKYRTWLEEEVVYIIAEVEKETFLRLEGEMEWDAFIQAFWRKRDTNPSTLENEFREEHYSRLAFANKFLGRDTFRPGWRTDKGRYHILLGPPRNVQTFDTDDSVYPVELWFYNDSALKRYGLPPFFYLLFVRRQGNGELELYSPLADGPQTLLTGYQTTSMDFSDDVERAYYKLFAIHPDLAHASLSFRTDEGDTAFFMAPAFGTLSLLDQIVDAPFRGVDTSYAEHFDAEKGLVESDYLFSYAPSWGMMDVLPGPGNRYYCHWVIEIDPQHIALVKDEDRNAYGSVFIISIEVVPRGDADRIVLQQTKESFMILNEREAKTGRTRPYTYRGMIPLVPGAYDVRVILRNRACPSRDTSQCRKVYTILQSPVDVPEWVSDEPRLSNVVLAYGTERPTTTPVYRPYRFGSLQLLPNPRRAFAINDTLVAMVEALDAEPGSRLRFQVFDQENPGAVQVETSHPVEGLKLEPLVQELSLEGLPGGRYRLVVELLDVDDKVLANRTSDFDVTPRTSVLRPVISGSWPQVLPEVPGLVEMALAEQYLNLEQKDKARELLKAAVKNNPKLGPARETLANLLLEEGDSARVVELLEPIYEVVKDRYVVLALLGEAYFHEENFPLASELLEKAVALRRPDSRLLNFLAASQGQLGNNVRAREVLLRSLEIEPDQPSVKELLDSLEAQEAKPPREPSYR